MKKLVSLLLITVMVCPSLALAAKERRECPECVLKTNAAQEEKLNRICNDVSDVICKDVKPDERRACSESDETIFSKETTKNDLFNFAKGCFKSGVTSFTQFFTDFIPELLKGIWEANKAVYSLAVKSVTSDEPGLWSKLKGMYESTASVAADIYEAVQENPGAYFDKIWSKVIDVVQPMVANYDCLKPQRKVEKICGFVAEWVVPPAMLAKILVKGVKEVKFLKESGAFSASASGKLAKALEFSEKRSLLSLKKLQAMEVQFKTLGYTREEFALLYKSGALDKINLSELKALTTAEGKAQKAKLLGEAPKVATAAATTTAVHAAPKKPAAEPKAKPAVLDIRTDFFTTTKIGPNGEKFIGQGQILERYVVNGKESSFRVRMVDAGGGIHETSFTAAELASMNAKTASKEVAERVADVVERDTKRNIALQKKQAPEVPPDDLKTIEVHETDFAAFQEAQRAQNQVQEIRKTIFEAPTKPVKVEGMNVVEVGMDDFYKAQEAQKAAGLKAQADLAALEKAAYLAEQKRIKEQGLVQHDGMGVEELAHDDPRYLELFGGGKPAVTKYENGVEYVDPQFKGQIVKSKDKIRTPEKPVEGKPITGVFQTNYIEVMAKNSMGMTTFMPAQIVRKILQDNKEKYVIRMLDKASNTYKEQTVSLTELRTKMRAKEVPKVEAEFKEFNRQTGFQELGP